MEGIRTGYNGYITAVRTKIDEYICNKVRQKSNGGVQEQIIKEQTIQEQATQEQTIQEQATQEQATQEQAAQEQIASEQADVQTQQIQQSVRRHRWMFIFTAAAVSAVAAGGLAAYLVSHAGPKGYHDYTVQKQQHYVEYSDKYPYWDVLTVEYPILTGTEEEPIERVEQINARLYDTAMDRVNYWHLYPNAEVERLQEDYSIFSSDVECDVTYHSQYLMSVNYRETYAPISPVWYVYMTQRAVTMDLVTGESYALKDVLRLNEDFITLWVDKFNEKLGEKMIASEDVDIFFDWFHCLDQELERYYDFVPYFYVTEEGEFVVGVSLDPKAAAISVRDPSNSTFYTQLTAEEIAPFRTESVFWDRYDKSESTGEVLRCKEKHDNIWLGDQASVWDFWEEE